MKEKKLAALEARNDDGADRLIRAICDEDVKTASTTAVMYLLAILWAPASGVFGRRFVVWHLSTLVVVEVL